MEISRSSKPVSATVVDAPAKLRQAPVAASAAAARPAASGHLPLEQLQDALRALPEADLDKVAAIRQALQRGDISTDPDALAGSMLAYHRGSDA